MQHNQELIRITFEDAQEQVSYWKLERARRLIGALYSFVRKPRRKSGLFCWSLPGHLRRFKFSDVREIAILLLKVQPVTNHIIIKNIKAYVGQIEINDSAAVAIKQRADIEARRSTQS